MKKLAQCLATIPLILLLLPAGVYAQVGLYNPNTIERIEGRVVRVERVPSPRGPHLGVHLIVKTVTETLSVHLGPAWFIDRLETKFEPGDAIEVKGSRVTYQGKPAIIASKVYKGDQVLKLRHTSDGFPYWRGWKRRL